MNKYSFIKVFIGFIIYFGTFLMFNITLKYYLRNLRKAKPKIKAEIKTEIKKIVSKLDKLELTEKNAIEDNANEDENSELLIETVGNVVQQDIDILINEINETIPKWLLDLFILKKWKIRITTENISKQYLGNKFGNVMAVIEFDCKRIVIEKGSIESSLAHEFGHFLEHTCIYPISNSEEFKDIYEREVNLFKSQILSGECVFNESEFYAEQFYYSRKDPSKCTKDALEYIEMINLFYKEGAHI